jgi:hypothetical protein
MTKRSGHGRNLNTPFSNRLRLALIAAVLTTNGPAYTQDSSDVLRQFDGLWTSEWMLPAGGTKIEQVLFSKNLLNRHAVALPFQIGLATITICQADCAGADITVSGTSFECHYTYAQYGQDAFYWIFKSGQGPCPPSGKFVRVVSAMPPPVPATPGPSAGLPPPPVPATPGPSAGLPPPPPPTQTGQPCRKEVNDWLNRHIPHGVDPFDGSIYDSEVNWVVNGSLFRKTRAVVVQEEEKDRSLFPNQSYSLIRSSAAMIGNQCALTQDLNSHRQKANGTVENRAVRITYFIRVDANGPRIVEQQIEAPSNRP